MQYLTIYLIVSVLRYLECFDDFRNSKKKTIYLAILLSYLVLIASFRYEVGPDWDSYISFYRDFNKSALLIEPGYTWLNNFYSKENIPYTVFLLSINSFSMYLITSVRSILE